MRLSLLFFLGFCGLFLCSTSTLSRDCSSQSVLIEGSSLSPLIKEGQTILMQPASCTEEIMRGDVVVFRTGASDRPVAKIIKAVPGDRFRVEGGYIFINDEKLKISTGEFYMLPENKALMLSLYEKNYKGVIPIYSYLVLGNIRTGGIDSSRIGLIGRSDIIMVAVDDKKQEK